MSDASEEDLSALRIQVARLEWVVVGLALSCLGFFMVLALVSSAAIPRFAVIFGELTAGRPLPQLSQWIVDLGAGGGIGSVAFLVSLGAAIYLVVNRRSLASWITVLLAVFFLLFLTATVSLALYLPFIEILQGLQEGA